MKYIRTFSILVVAILLAVSAQAEVTPEEMGALGVKHQDTLRMSSYMTAGSVRGLASNEVTRVEALRTLQGMGVTKVYLEVYRGGTTLTPDELMKVKKFLGDNKFQVSAGIATVPGGDVGVRQDGAYGWFNWQNPKTQADLEAVVRMAAPLFDEFIVDDFLCTDDKSAESEAAKGERSWGEYRRDLLTALSQKIFIGPAKEENPDIRMIIKYPQWYDLFHRFGYDPERETQLYDGVYIGTETRGAKTQRFGFIQPTLGYNNYKWLGGIAGDKRGGAWFDYGDCDANDFIEQAWHSVLAGTPEIVLFNFNNLVVGHDGNQLLRNDYEDLVRAARLSQNPKLWQYPAYKPIHSEPGGDMYLIDAMGMFALPLVPTHEWPEGQKVIFLPTQAASDPEIVTRIMEAVAEGKTLVMTAGLLAELPEAAGIHKLAGMAEPLTHDAFKTKKIYEGEALTILKRSLYVESKLNVRNADVLLYAHHQGERIPVLTTRKVGAARIAVLNLHTYNQADFDAVGEVLLAPAPLGMLDLPQTWVDTIRNEFTRRGLVHINAPARVSVQNVGDLLVFQNNNDHEVEIRTERAPYNEIDVLRFSVPARDRAIIQFGDKVLQLERVPMEVASDLISGRT